MSQTWVNRSKAGGRGTSDQSLPPAEVLVQGLRSGDLWAVEEVRKRVRKIIRFRGFNFTFEEREDLEQEAVIQVWQAVHKSGFDPNRGFWSFIEVVTARRCIDWFRTRRVGSELPPHEPDKRASPLGLSLAREKRHLAIEILGVLDEDCREVIYLHAGLGKSYREIAELLGRSEGALRVQVHRCIKAAQLIRKRLDPPDPALSVSRRTTE